MNIEINMGEKKKFFVVSDIHGCATVFKSCLRSAKFEKDNPNHVLLCLGDCFDRGFENVEVLKIFPFHHVNDYYISFFFVK